MKQQDGLMLQVHGSSNLIQTLPANDLVDELWLKIFRENGFLARERSLKFGSFQNPLDFRAG